VPLLARPAVPLENTASKLAVAPEYVTVLSHSALRPVSHRQGHPFVGGLSFTATVGNNGNRIVRGFFPTDAVCPTHRILPEYGTRLMGMGQVA
jgi:hypothetical protein